MNPQSLPEKALEKFRALQFASADAEALAATVSQQLDTLSKRLAESLYQVQTASHEALALKAQETANALQQQVEQLREVYNRRQSDFETAQQSVAQADLWIGRLPPSTQLEILEDVKPPALRKDESPAQALTRLRTEIAEVERELNQVRMAPMPREDLRVLVASHVAQRARRGKPRLSVLQDQLRIEFTNEKAWTQGGIDEFVNLLCWSNAEHMSRRLWAELDDQVDVKDALPRVEREKRINQLASRLEKLCLTEEGIVEMAALQGLILARRISAPAGIVLGLRVVKANVEQAA